MDKNPREILESMTKGQTAAPGADFFFDVDIMEDFRQKELTSQAGRGAEASGSEVFSSSTRGIN